jgi:hypothetical protein
MNPARLVNGMFLSCSVSDDGPHKINSEQMKDDYTE